MDGNHRVYALYNMGYKNAELLIYDPKLTEKWGSSVTPNNLLKYLKEALEKNPQEFVRDTRTQRYVCLMSAMYNLVVAYNHQLPCTLVLGQLTGAKEKEGNYITHCWVVVDGDEIATNEPKNANRFEVDKLDIDLNKDLYTQVEQFLEKPSLKEALVKKTHEIENGFGNIQYIEEYDLKGIKEVIKDNYIENKDYVDDDMFLFIRYKDGSTYVMDGSGEEGKFKWNGIKTVIEDNGSTYSVYGDWDYYIDGPVYVDEKDSIKAKGMSESLKESKTFTFPNIEKAIEYYWKDRNATIEKLPIKQLVDDNNLLNDEDLQSYHQRAWDNKKASEFSINQDKVNNMRMSEVPYAVKKKNGKLELGDGRHRVRALYNDGYDYVVMPLLIDENLQEHYIEKTKDKTGRDFTIATEHMDVMGEQSQWCKIAYVGDDWMDDNDRVIRDNILGVLEYSTYSEDEPNTICYVEMIQTKYNEKRKGIASALVKSLQKDYKDIHWGYTTDEGTQLLKSLGIREDLEQLHNYIEDNYGTNSLPKASSYILENGKYVDILGKGLEYHGDLDDELVSTFPEDEDIMNYVDEDGFIPMNLVKNLFPNIIKMNNGSRDVDSMFIELSDNVPTEAQLDSLIRWSLKLPKDNIVIYNHKNNIQAYVPTNKITKEYIKSLYGVKEDSNMEIKEAIQFDKDEQGRDIFYKYAFDGNEVKVSPYRLNPRGNYDNRTWDTDMRLTPNEQKEYLDYLISLDTEKINELTRKRTKEYDEPISKLQQEVENAKRVKTSYGQVNESFDDNNTIEFVYVGTPLKELDPTHAIWFTEDYDYAMGYGDNVFTCSISMKNPFDCGCTDGYIRALIPTQFSKEFIDLANRLGVEPKQLLRCNPTAKNIFAIVRTRAFRDIVKSKGYDGLETFEFGHVCYQTFYPNQVEVIDVDTDEDTTQAPMDESKNK